jgi:gamma-glutamyl-gamma-aminobutyrate hydrolase PuuD
VSDLVGEQGYLVDGLIIPGGESTSMALIGGEKVNVKRTRYSEQDRMKLKTHLTKLFFWFLFSQIEMVFSML